MIGVVAKHKGGGSQNEERGRWGGTRGKNDGVGSKKERRGRKE